LSKKRRQEIQNINRQACSAQRELDHANQGGNQVILLARCEFDGNHRGLCHTLGEMTTVCGKCNALHFLEERVASSLCTNPQFTLCCTQGKVRLPPLAPPPKPLRRLFIGNEADVKDFRQRIRFYNNALPFTSVGANLAIILTVFVVNFTIGWGVYFLSLTRPQNLPNCTSAIRMPSLMVGWAILVA
jgi:hypothetical protein